MIARIRLRHALAVAALLSSCASANARGGPLWVIGLGSELERLLGPGLAAGGTSGLGALYDILQTGGQEPLVFGFGADTEQ
jgi:hypothetical protein